MDKISIIVPCYNEEEVLNKFYDEVASLSKKMSLQSFEFLFIDDGSRDGTLNLVKALKRTDDRVHYLSFSRNFGKEAAMYAGLKNAAGDYIAIMDADLQDPPELLEEMYRLITAKSIDCVATRRMSRQGEPPVRSFFSHRFYKLINHISKTNIVEGARDFRLMTRKMVDSILSMEEINRFSKGIFSWVGFETEWLSYENVERAAGETKWSFWALFKYAIDGIIAFSTMPLIASSFIGLFFCCIAFLMVFVFMFKTIIWGDPVAGYPSLICIIFFIGGIQLFCMGIIGQYLAKLYLETKKRPIYIVNEQD